MRHHAWKLALGAAATAVYFVLPTQQYQDVDYVAIGLLSAGLILAGVRLQQPQQRLPWLLLAGYILLSLVGDGIENIGYGMILNRPVPLPSIADAFYLAAYPLLFVAVIRLCYRPHDGIIVVAALALSWNFLMGSYFHDGSINLFGKFVTIAYPLMDLGLLFIIVRSLLFGHGRLPLHRILTVALLAGLVADSVYDVMVLYGNYSIGNPVDAGGCSTTVFLESPPCTRRRRRNRRTRTRAPSTPAGGYRS
jgi:hypothetical protein